MYIKVKHYDTGFIQVLNINVSQYSGFYAKNNQLQFIDEQKNEKWITFPTQAEAETARDAVFYTLSLKAPANGHLDLTNVGESTITESDIVELTLKDIAYKFKADPRNLHIIEGYDQTTENNKNILLEDEDEEENSEDEI